jgi:enoyl-CoA hydratase/isomerase-like protein
VGQPTLDATELVALARARRLSTLFGAARDAPIVFVDLTARDAADIAEAAEPVTHAPTARARHLAVVRDDGSAGVEQPGSEERGEPERFDAAALRANTDLGTLPAVIVGIGPRDHPDAALVDVVAADADEAAALADATASRPIASAALALLLRHGEDRSIAAGLVAESATYSMLQAGPEFAAWRRSRRGRKPRTLPTPVEPPVLVQRQAMMYTIVLNRPERHNAVNTAMSELLVETLTDALEEGRSYVILIGSGRSFCSGGDLDEFGSFDSPADAHGVRLLRSAGQLVAMLGERSRVHIHGAAMGAGIELPAFAHLVLAQPSTTIALPELELGLVPGAGGTVSLPRRIGRHRTAWLALTGRVIDAETALDWGLVDEITEDD